MKLIDKYLDRYYTDKFLEEIGNIFYFYELDCKLIWKKLGVEIQLKPYKYSDEYFKHFDFINYNNGLYYFIAQDKYKEKIGENIVDFKKNWN